MKLKLGFALAFTFFTVALYAQKADRAFVENVVSNYKKAASISYDANYKIKYFDNEDVDTTTVNGHCKLIRDAKDTIFGGGRIWMDFDADTDLSNYSLYYDLEYLYIIEPNKKELTKFEPLKDETGPITAATQGVLKNTFFLKPERLLEYLDDNNNRCTIEEVKTDAKKMVRVIVNFPDEDDISNQNIAVYINLKTGIIEKITFFCQLLDQHQYNEWNLSNITFNSVNQNALNSKLKDYASKYLIKDFEFPKEELTGLVQGTPAPQFTAQLYSTGLQTQLSDYKGKIVLLDFWYAACAPCASASPHLTALQQKYRDAVVVIGVNPSETYADGIKKVEGFTNRYKVGYTVAAIEASVADAYKVAGFPTLYLIDKDGIVQYSEPGFGENLKSFENLIDNMLKKK